PERSRSRDRDEDSPRMARVEENRVQAHASGAGLPGRSGLMHAQPGQLLPRLPAVGRTEQGGVLDTGVDRVGVGQRGLEAPYARELPRMRRSVVPEVRPSGTVVEELVPHRLPRLAAVVRALDDLPEPTAGLRGVQAIRVDGRSLEVIDLPAAEVRAAHVPSA